MPNGWVSGPHCGDDDEYIRNVHDQVTEQSDRIEELEAENQRLRAALKDQEVQMKVTVGRIVHFYPNEISGIPQGPFAAVVSRVFDQETGCSNLHVFMDTPIPIMKTSILRSESGGPEAGRWCWPPREVPEHQKSNAELAS